MAQNVRIIVSIPRAQREALNNLAAASDRSQAQLVRQAIRELLERLTKEDAK